MAEKKRHHYVPECYLEGFSKDKMAYAFFKNKMEIHHPNISNLCVKSRFYELDEHFLTEEKDKMFLENDFFGNTVERIFPNVIDKIKCVIDEMLSSNLQYAKVNLSDSIKRSIAYLILIQHFRTPKFRKLFEGKSFLLREPYINKHGEIIHSIDDPVNAHAKGSYTNAPLMKELSYFLADGHWIFRYSPNGNFCTSDTPIVVYDSKQSEYKREFTTTQMGNPNSVVFFPINHSILLEISGKDVYPENKDYDGFIFSVDKDYEEKINVFSYLNAENIIISYSGDFNFLRTIISIQII